MEFLAPADVDILIIASLFLSFSVYLSILEGKGAHRWFLVYEVLQGFLVQLLVAKASSGSRLTIAGAICRRCQAIQKHPARKLTSLVLLRLAGQEALDEDRRYNRIEPVSNKTSPDCFAILPSIHV